MKLLIYSFIRIYTDNTVIFHNFHHQLEILNIILVILIVCLIIMTFKYLIYMILFLFQILVVNLFKYGSMITSKALNLSSAIYILM